MFKGRTNTGAFTPLFAVAVASAVLLSVVAGAGISLSDVAGGDGAPERQALDGEALSGDTDLEDANTTLLGEGENDTAGWVVASAGDVNGDGRADVLVGAPRNDSTGNDSGAVYVFYGPVDTGNISLSAADVRLTGASPGDLAGADIAASDLDGDDRSDLIVGAPYNDSTGSDAGTVYVVYGSSELSGTVSLADAHVTLRGVAPGDRAGRSVATVNGSDGVHDLVVGAPYNDSAGNDSGAAYVLNGTELGSGSLASAATFTGASSGDLAGWDVSSAGDFDGDGLDDVVVGARHNDSGGNDAGAAYVIPGVHRLDGGSLASATVELRGGAAGDNAGYAVSDAGDVNDDGYDDVLVGAPLNDSAGSNAGAAYVVYGSASPAGNTPLANANLTLRGVSAGDRAGWSVSSAGSGDVNCDSYADVLVGAPYNNSTAPDAGAAYLVHGGQADSNQSLADANATFSGTGAGDLAGWSVSEAEDANGDGADDLLIGAPYNDTSGTDAGVAYLLGGSCSEEPETQTKSPTPTHTKTTTRTATATPKPTPTAEPSPKPTPKNDSGNGSDAVEFINCSAVRIHGDYEGILLNTRYLEIYVNNGEDVYHSADPNVVPAQTNGTTVIDLSGMEGPAMYIKSVELAEGHELKPDHSTGEPDMVVSNPHEYGYDSCIDESRDPDGDGFTSQAERHTVGTNPNHPDTDGDGLVDGRELGSTAGTPQSDQYMTHPEDPDTDDDGYLDGAEVEAGTDPLDSNDHPSGEPGTPMDTPTPTATPTPEPPSDDAVEFINCSAVRIHGDYEGVLLEGYYLEGPVDANEYFYENPYLEVVPNRTEGTTVIDLTQREAAAVYIDSVLLARDNEVRPDSMSDEIDVAAQNPNEYGYDSCIDESRDPDGDGYTSSFERNIVGTEPDNPDTDDDGLVDGDELGGNVSFTPQSGKFMTDPFAPDTDGDGYQDGEEVEAGTDPLDPNDYPGSTPTTTTDTTTTDTTTTVTTTTGTTASADASVEFLDCQSARVEAPEGYAVRYSGFAFVETGQGAAHPNWLDPIKEDEWSGGEDVLSTDNFYPDDSERADRAVLASVAVFDSDYQQVASASNPDAESASDLCGQEAECTAANQGITGADPETCEGSSASRSASTPSETTTSGDTTGASSASMTALTTETTATETTAETTSGATTGTGTTSDQR